MSWLFSRALVEAFSADTCSDGEPSAQLNVMPTQHRFWRNDRTMEPSDLSRFGLTCAVLTEGRGEALLTWFREASRARTLAPQGKEPGSKASEAGCGRNLPGSFARFDPDTSSWRTAQYSLLGGLALFSEIWPRWGSMRNGASFLRPIPELRTSANASGLWPTLTASIGKKCGGRHRGKADTLSSKLAEVEGLSTSSTSLVNPTWAEWFMGWPIGWTDLAPLGMDKFREWQQQHSIFSASDPREAA